MSGAGALTGVRPDTRPAPGAGVEGLSAIDCDVHPNVPALSVLLPYFDDHWRDTIVGRGMASLDSAAYPDAAPITARPDWRRGNGAPPATVEALVDNIVAPHGLRHAILNPLYGVQLPFDEYMGAAFARALNSWIKAEWLDRDERLRASVVVPMQSVEAAVAEIEHWAPDRRFVQVLLLAMNETPLGHRRNWPVYEAAVRHGLTVGVHAGSAYRQPVTSVGWPTYYVEDYAAQSQGFQGALASLVTEGVFAAHPGLTVVLLESGVTWLPAFLWRLSKFWRGVRAEVPWVDRPPADIVRQHVRLTIQPFDAPDDAGIIDKVIEEIGSDHMLLYASDYPHWQFDGDNVLPAGFPARLVERLAVANPLATYPRLGEARS